MRHRQFVLVSIFPQLVSQLCRWVQWLWQHAPPVSVGHLFYSRTPVPTHTHTRTVAGGICSKRLGHGSLFFCSRTFFFSLKHDSWANIACFPDAGQICSPAVQAWACDVHGVTVIPSIRTCCIYYRLQQFVLFLPNENSATRGTAVGFDSVVSRRSILAALSLEGPCDNAATKAQLSHLHRGMFERLTESQGLIRTSSKRGQRRSQEEGTETSSRLGSIKMKTRSW